MDVSLPPQLEEFVRAQARSGRYVDEEDVVREIVDVRCGHPRAPHEAPYELEVSSIESGDAVHT